MKKPRKTYIDYGFTGLSADQQVVVLDIETTGLNIWDDEIIGVKLLKCRLDAPTEGLFQDNDTFDQRYYADGPMSPEALAVHHIRLDSLKGAPELSSAAQSIRAFIGPHPLISHHVRFAQDFLSVAFERAGVDSLAANKGYCTLYRLREHTGLKHGEWFRRSLDDAATYLGIDTNGYNGDERWAPLILKILMAYFWWQYDENGKNLFPPPIQKRQTPLSWKTMLFALALGLVVFLLFK